MRIRKYKTVEIIFPNQDPRACSNLCPHHSGEDKDNNGDLKHCHLYRVGLDRYQVVKNGNQLYSLRVADCMIEFGLLRQTIPLEDSLPTRATSENGYGDEADQIRDAMEGRR